jgi:hypothetical protein
MDEPRGTALSRLGLVKASAHLGRDAAHTAADLAELRSTLDRIGLRHARDMVDKAAAELGVGPLPDHGGHEQGAARPVLPAVGAEALQAADVEGLR